MKNLYSNLKSLVEDNDTPFYSSVQSLNGEEIYEIFSYHFTDKDSWLKPDALESRGIMFEIDRDGNPLRLASRPMSKFFNAGEVDFIDYGNVEHVMNKADGSLISSYLDANGNIKLKSKTSISSDYAQLAMDLLYTDTELFDFVKWCERDGYTVNMELVSPDPMYRIVLYYNEPQLIVLNARHRDTGEYMDMRSMPEKYFTGFVDIDALNHLDTITNVEGYVTIDDKGQWAKHKCAWYLERHRAKDFINQPNAFIELVLKDEADDVFALIADQPEVLAEMQALQHKVNEYANTYVNNVTAYYNENKELSRKDYAIKGKAELSGFEFPAAMMYYGNGEEPNWKELLLRFIKKIDWDI